MNDSYEFEISRIDNGWIVKIHPNDYDKRKVESYKTLRECVNRVKVLIEEIDTTEPGEAEDAPLPKRFFK